MPPDAAPVAAPATPAAVVLPPADQPPAATGTKSFNDRWAAAEAKVGGIDDSAAAAPAPAATPDKPAPAAPKPTETPSATEPPLTVQEAIEIRAQKRKNLAWKAEREAEFAKKEAEFEATHGEKLKKSSAVFDAFERGDPEAFAAALGAKDFNELQQSWIKRLADPNYMELRRLQKRAEEEDAKREAEAKTTQERAELEQHQKVKAGYMQSLSETCKASSNPLVAAMHDDPLFLNAVYAIQGENWDGEKTVTVEEAIKKAARGAKTDLETELRALHERLGKAFVPAEAATPAAAAAPKPNGKKPAPKTAVVPANSGGGVSAAKKPGDMSPQEWRKHFVARMNEAED